MADLVEQCLGDRHDPAARYALNIARLKVAAVQLVQVLPNHDDRSPEIDVLPGESGQFTEPETAERGEKH
jgi:hypothetical protein